MGRKRVYESTLTNVTVRIESEFITAIKLYSQAVGKSQTQIMREFLISAIQAIPEHQKQAMEVIAKCRASN